MPLGRSESGGLGFSVTAGGPGGQLAVVRRVWDRRHCPSLQPGDAIVKINGADVQSFTFSQVNEFEPFIDFWMIMNFSSLLSSTVLQKRSWPSGLMTAWN